MFNDIKEIFMELVLPIMICLGVVGLVFGIVRGAMYLISHVWLSISI